MILFHTLGQQIWTVAMLAVSAFAWWRGGWPERTMAVANVAASLLNGLVQNRHDWIDPQWGDLVIDLLFLGLLLWLALRSNRHWPMWASAFQLLGVVTHVAMMADHRIGGWAYVTGGVIFSYLVLGSLGVGTLLLPRGRPESKRPA